MTMKKLNPGASLRCPPGALALEWRVKGTNLVDVLAERVASPGVASAGTRQTGPTRREFPSPTEPLTLVVQSRDGRPLPAGLLVEVRLSVAVSATDSSDVVLPRADVSGLTRLPIATLEPRTGFVLVTALEDVRPAPGSFHSDAPGPGTPADDTTPIAPQPEGSDTQRRATYAARRLAGSTHLPSADAVDLLVALDRSASMDRLVRDGTVGALLDVLLGVNDVAGRDKHLPVWALESTPARLGPALTPSSADDWMQRELVARATTAGTSLAPLLPRVRTSASLLVVVITDGVPPDLVDVVTELAATGDPTRYHVLAVARSASDPTVRAEPWRDELYELRSVLSASSAVTSSSVRPGKGTGWLVGRLEDEDELDALIAALPMWTAVGAVPAGVGA